MISSKRHRSLARGLGLAAAAIALAPACNAVLDNRPGVLDTDGLDGGAASDIEDPGAGALPGDDGETGREQRNESGRGPSSSSGSSSSGKDGGAGAADAASSGPDAGDADAEAPCPVCALPHAVSACVAGQCVVTACDPGFADCDLLPANGCEADLATPASCGACNVVCPVVPNTVAACAGGACTLTCQVGFADCNEKVEDGCEAELAKDRRNCGACGTRCLVGKCEAAMCTFDD